MIKKVLIIHESGLLPFYLSQDDTNIDGDLLSGFCQAIFSISIELTFPLKHIGFEKNKMLVQNINNPEKKRRKLQKRDLRIIIDSIIDQRIKLSC